jgi:short subunit dehydrogenase-like uncharacterized protein
LFFIVLFCVPRNLMPTPAPSRSQTAREFDVVLYGASGFVGQQTVAYFAQHAPAGLSWAIAGRSEAKLQQTRSAVAAAHEGCANVPIVVADAHDSAALKKLAARTRVVLTTAGPYAKFGTPLLEACVAQGTHYVDITGETPWVKAMIDAHHNAARTAKLKIVPFCGFDSIPSDLGVHLLQREMRKRHGQPCTHIKSLFTLGGGGFNGGTLDSLMNIMNQGQGQMVQDLFLLNPAGTRPKDLGQSEAAHADAAVPMHDADFKAWAGPFLMAPINTRVVRRASAFRGEQLVYEERMRFGRGAGAAVFGAMFSAGYAATQTALKFSPTRRLIGKFMLPPGQGPSEAAMNKGFFKCELIGTSASGERLRAVVADQGDAGNRATTKMLCEAALALAVDAADLPSGKDSFGVVPPSVAMGDVLERRLLSAGMRVEVAAL